MPTETKDARARWDVRIRRAQELVDHHSAIANSLRLYHAALQIQSDLAAGSASVVDATVPLRQQIDLNAAVLAMPAILTAADRGPDQLRFEAHKVRQGGEDRWRQILRAVLLAEESVEVAAHDFLARACLQPLAENLQLQLPKDPDCRKNSCPACGGLPQLAIVRPGIEGTSRSLLCSFCLCEWPFRQIVCPWCGEEEKEKLPHYRSEEWAYVHVEACDTCQHYFKVVDLSIEGAAVPLVDEAALAVLDVWATGLGYTKITRNMIGF